MKKAIKEIKPLRGKELLRAAVNQIIDHPKRWKQGIWHCGTSHCIGGWCQILGGLPESNGAGNAANLLGLSKKDADWLFAPYRTMQEIYDFAKAFINGKQYFNVYGYSPDGFNRYGYDRDGYNRSGRDSGGYDRNGYDCDGYDREGYNREGYNHCGFDRENYDRTGYDYTGFDRKGFDRAGYNRDGYNRKKKRRPQL